MKLNIGEEQFIVKVASSEASRKRGLSGVKSLPKGNGLVLKYSEPTTMTVTMKGMNFPLDLIFIKDYKVIAVKKANTWDTDIDIGKPIDMVLEVNAGDKGSIKIGNDVSWIGEKTDKDTIIMAEGGLVPEGTLHVLDEDGKVQMNTMGNERVFSRIHTRQLYNLSVNAKNPSDFKRIGRAMVRMLNKQNTQPLQFSKN